MLNDPLKNKVISPDLLPYVISRYSELKVNFDKNQYGETLKQVMKSVDSSFMTDDMIPSSEILLLSVAINLVQIEKAQQSQKLDFFEFLPNIGMRKCSNCNVLNIPQAKYCYSCGQNYSSMNPVQFCRGMMSHITFVPRIRNETTPNTALVRSYDMNHTSRFPVKPEVT
jgi:hypothetical protein